MAGGPIWTEDEISLAMIYGQYDQYVIEATKQGFAPRPQGGWRSKRSQYLTQEREREERKPRFTFEGPGAPALSDTPTLEEFLNFTEEVQRFRKRTSPSTSKAIIGIDTDEPVCLVAVGDLHFGAIDIAVNVFRQMLDDFTSHPNVYIGLLGDMMQLALGFHGVAETFSNALTTEQQYMMTEQFLDRMLPQIAFGVWGNHDAREERVLGSSRIGRMFAERCITYSNGIAHFDLRVGQQVYKIAATHVFPGRSQYSPVFGAMKYTKWQGHNRDLLMAGDSHQPGIAYWWEGDPPKRRVAINCGSIQTESAYAKRYFSLYTNPVYPCVELHPHEHRMVAYPSVQDWLIASGKDVSPDPGDDHS